MKKKFESYILILEIFEGRDYLDAEKILDAIMNDEVSDINANDEDEMHETSNHPII